MSGRLLGQRTLPLRPGAHLVSFAVRNRALLQRDGRVLVSFDAANGGVQALSLR